MLKKQKVFIAIVLLQLVQISYGMYLKPAVEKSNHHNAIKSNDEKDEWSVFKKKLGLTNQKVQLLKSQKDQQATMDMLKRFIKENPKYITLPNAVKQPQQKTQKTDAFLKIYQSLVQQLKKTKGSLKTSLNFELADKPLKNLKRTRRKIAVKMVSDISSEKIDDLLKMFNQQHGIDTTTDTETDSEVHDNDADYTDMPVALPTAMDPDYLYENLYEDEEDLAAPTKSHHNSQFGSFQDLILQAKRNQWEREIEETKLRINHNNEHFI